MFEEVKEINKDIPLIIADSAGSVTYINKKFEEVFLYSEVEIIGKPLCLIIPENMQDAHNMGFSRFLATEVPTLLHKPLTLNAVKKNGEEFPAEHIIAAEKVNGEWFFSATIKPL